MVIQGHSDLKYFFNFGALTNFLHYITLHILGAVDRQQGTK